MPTAMSLLDPGHVPAAADAHRAAFDADRCGPIAWMNGAAVWQPRGRDASFPPLRPRLTLASHADDIANPTKPAGLRDLESCYVAWRCLGAASAAPLCCLRLIRIGKQITTSRPDLSDHLVENVAGGPLSAVPQIILNALPKYVLGYFRMHFGSGLQLKTYD